MGFLGRLLTGLTLLLLPALASAQDFPNKPIKLIVPFPPGGPNDIIARVVGQRMSELMKQPVVIDNRGGQGGVLGTDAVAKAAPDGYTIGIVSASSLVINPTMEKVPYDVAKDFAPVTLVTTVPEMLVVASNVAAKDMGELVALAKGQPGKLNFASAGVGGLPHLAGELFKLTARIDIVHVPYRGAAPAINDLLGQQVQMAFLDLPVILPHIKSGMLRPIALGAPQTRADLTRGADHRGGRHAGSPDRKLVRHDRPGRHAREYRQPPQPRHQRGDERSAGRAEARRPGPHRRRRHPGAFSRLHRRRDQKMGEGDQGRRHRDDEVRMARVA